MKAKAIVSEWLAYTGVHPMPYAEDIDEIALLYGLDEIKVDWLKNRIKLRGFGWMMVVDLGKVHSFDWMAVHGKAGEWFAMLGTGLPFSPEAHQALPTKNGIILAMPNAFVTSRRSQAAESRAARPLLL